MAGVRAGRNPSLQRMGQGGEPHPRATGRSPLQGWIPARRTPKVHPLRLGRTFRPADVPLSASSTGSRRVESRRGVLDGCDGLAVRGRPPLDPSTWLRVSGPATGDGFRLSAAGMTEGVRVSRCATGDGFTPRRPAKAHLQHLRLALGGRNDGG